MSKIKCANTTGKYRDLATRHDLIHYITDPRKTTHGFIFCGNVEPTDPAADMDRVAAQFGKQDGVQARHFIFSFSPAEVRYPQIVACIAREIAAYLGQEYQTVCAVHENRPSLHIHAVFNSVSYLDGHRYRGRKEEFYSMLHHVNGVLRQYGVSSLEYISLKN
jgi:hypothetical protein